MSLERITHSIAADAPGTAAELTVFRIGPKDAKEKVYLQAALHADEQPGIMAIHHLLPLLEAAEAKGQLRSRFTLLPMVNPLGMGQRLFEDHVGRYDFRGGVNFNRRWPDLFAAVGETVAPRLTDDPEANVATIRSAVRDWLAAQKPLTANQKLRHLVMTEAYDADYVL